jgi:hypothetical protein
MINQNAVENFISSMDVQEPRKMHLINLWENTYSQGWNYPTYKEILRQIERKYPNKY